MNSARLFLQRPAFGAAALAAVLAFAPASARAASGFGPLSGPGGCAVSPGEGSSEQGHLWMCRRQGAASAPAPSPSRPTAQTSTWPAGSTARTSRKASAAWRSSSAALPPVRSPRRAVSAPTAPTGATAPRARAWPNRRCSAPAASPSARTAPRSMSVRPALPSVVAFSRDAASGALTRLGCFQGTPRPGAPCGAAKPVLQLARLGRQRRRQRAVCCLAAGRSRLDARQLRQPAHSVGHRAGFERRTDSGASGTPASTTAAPTTASAPTPAASASPTPRPVSSIFSTSLAGSELLNPCIAVNGLDGACSVGTATRELDALALSSDGKQVYGTAPGSSAIDVFTPGAGGALQQTGCLMVSAPHGLCSSAALASPFALAVSPDGTSVYAASGDSIKESRLEGQRLDVLSRSAAAGALSSAGCVEYQEPPPPKEEEEQEEEGAESARASAAASGCTGVAGLEERQRGRRQRRQLVGVCDRQWRRGDLLAQPGHRRAHRGVVCGQRATAAARASPPFRESAAPL